MEHIVCALPVMLKFVKRNLLILVYVKDFRLVTSNFTDDMYSQVTSTRYFSNAFSTLGIQFSNKMFIIIIIINYMVSKIEVKCNKHMRLEKYVEQKSK